MRILLAVGSLRLGGAEKQVCGLACQLQEAGHQVKIVLLEGGGPLEAVLEGTGVEWEDPGRRRVRRDDGRLLTGISLIGVGVYRIWLIWRALLRFRPEVVHTYLPWSSMVVLPMAWIRRVPVRVGSRRNISEPTRGAAAVRLAERLAESCAHVVVANSNGVAEFAQRRGLPAHKIRIIHNGVSLAGQPAEAGADPPTGLVVANLRPVKGLLTLVGALRLLENPPIVRVVGEGPQRRRLETAIAEAGLEQVLILEGLNPNAHKLWAEAQFGILPSHEEGLPNAVLEAMAAGVPMIASRVGGVPELIEDGISGLMVPPAEPQALAGAIARLAGDPELRRRMGAAARQRAEEYSWPACARAHLELYEQCGARLGGGEPEASDRI